MQTLRYIPLVSKHGVAKPPLAPAVQWMPELNPPPQGHQTIQGGRPAILVP
jgi:hypothetical protein